MRRVPRSPAGLLAVLLLTAVAWVVTNGGENSSEPGTHAGDSALVRVDRVVDGDTAKVFYEGRSEYVRYIGIDTPESVKPDTDPECFSEEAKEFNRELLERDAQVQLVFDREQRDRYGRLLAYVYSGPTLLQAELLRGGYAETLVVAPNDSRADDFARLEREARAAGRGLWSAC